tara:strand:+ start:231 stop:884 length:654 start_codon:yes stop_codon:yes gene_type:complete
MTNWDKSMKILDYLEVAPFELSKEDYLFLLKAGDESRDKEGDEWKANPFLAGHIKNEYLLDINEKSIEFQRFILSVTDHEIFERYKASMNVVNETRPFCLSKLWINYQKKYEFNPVHIHLGFFSFVIFMKIPYDLEQEDKVYKVTEPTNGGSELRTSRFCFMNIDPLYGIKTHAIDVDKSFEGKGFMFRSNQAHTVYPFYTSDDTRITVSGNIVVKV